MDMDDILINYDLSDHYGLFNSSRIGIVRFHLIYINPRKQCMILALNFLIISDFVVYNENYH